MKSFDESNAWEFSRADESREMRDAGIIGWWKGQKIADLTIEVADSLLPGETLTWKERVHILRTVDKMAEENRAEIIREWEIAQAGDAE